MNHYITEAPLARRGEKRRKQGEQRGGMKRVGDAENMQKKKIKRGNIGSCDHDASIKNLK